MTTIPTSTARPGGAARGPAVFGDLRDRLTAARTEEQRLARAHLDVMEGLTGQPDADSGLAREAAQVAAAQAQETVGEIDAALGRLEAGTFGICERCGTAIPVERLQATPHARWCVRCPGSRAARFW